MFKKYSILFLIICLFIFPVSLLAYNDITPFPTANPTGPFLTTLTGGSSDFIGDDFRFTKSTFPYLNEILPPMYELNDYYTQIEFEKYTSLYFPKQVAQVSWNYDILTSTLGNPTNYRSHLNFDNLIQDFPYILSTSREGSDSTKSPIECISNNDLTNWTVSNNSCFSNSHYIYLFKDNPVNPYSLKERTTSQGIKLITLNFLNENNEQLIFMEDYVVIRFTNASGFYFPMLFASPHSSVNIYESRNKVFPYLYNFDIPNSFGLDYGGNYEYEPPTTHKKVEIPIGKKVLIEVPKTSPQSSSIFYDNSLSWNLSLYDTTTNKYFNKREGTVLYQPFKLNSFEIAPNNIDYNSDFPLLLQIANWKGADSLTKVIYIPKQWNYVEVDYFTDSVIIGDNTIIIDKTDWENEQEVENIFGNEMSGPLDSLLTLPLSFLSGLSTNLKNGSCSTVKLPLPFINKDLNLQCVDTLYSQMGVVGMLNTFSVFIGAFLLYDYLRSLFWWSYRIFTFEKMSSSVWGDDNV